MHQVGQRLSGWRIAGKPASDLRVEPVPDEGDLYDVRGSQDAAKGWRFPVKAIPCLNDLIAHLIGVSSNDYVQSGTAFLARLGSEAISNVFTPSSHVIWVPCDFLFARLFITSHHLDLCLAPIDEQFNPIDKTALI
jgi:hypothetical protein